MLVYQRVDQIYRILKTTPGCSAGLPTGELLCQQDAQGGPEPQQRQKTKKQREKRERSCWILVGMTFVGDFVGDCFGRSFIRFDDFWKILDVSFIVLPD